MHTKWKKQVESLKKTGRALFADRRDNGRCRYTPGQQRRIVGIRVTVVVNLFQWYLLPRIHVRYGFNHCHWLCLRTWWNWEYRIKE